MNLASIFTMEQTKLLNQAGVTIINKDYSKDELKIYFNDVIEYVMNNSLKNNNNK